MLAFTAFGMVEYIHKVSCSLPPGLVLKPSAAFKARLGTNLIGATVHDATMPPDKKATPAG